jgi:ABC-type multidrug transport system fused ATPase/permease subunit
MSYYDHQPEGRTVTRLTHDVESVEKFFADSLGKILKALLTLLAALAAMLVTSWKLGLFLIIAILPAVITTVVFKRKTREVMRAMSKNNSACNADLSEFMRGMDVIRNFALQNWITVRYDNTLKRYLNSVKRANSFFCWSRPTVDLLTNLPLILLLFLGGYQVFAGYLTVGILVSYIRYCENFTYPISILSREINTIQQAFTAVERIAIFLQEQQEDDVLGKGKINLDQMRGEIEFRNISMSYDKQKQVLHNVSFYVKPGEKVGFVGKTGCGKTTIMSLLARLYPFDQGDILIDGVSIKLLDKKFIRSQLGFITQDVTLFKATLRENLSLGQNFSDQDIMQACQQSRFSLVMQDKQMTLDYEILEGGSNLSVGERQLLSFTRVLLSRPSLFILDEATANIDEKYEQFLHEAIFNLDSQQTVLIIAHRVDTLKECDRIFHFDAGKLISIENIRNSS